MLDAILLAISIGCTIGISAVWLMCASFLLFAGGDIFWGFSDPTHRAKMVIFWGCQAGLFAMWVMTVLSIWWQ